MLVVYMPIDPADVISLGDELMERYPETFTGEFNENKLRVERLTEIQSRHVRNRIAGYITRNVAGAESDAEA